MRMQDEIRLRQKQELEILEENEKNTRISQLQHSIAWLSIDEKIKETEYERTSKRRHNRTCEWIANEPQLRSWMKDDAKRPCLWLSGKPGAGTLILRVKISLLIPLRQECHVLVYCSNTHEHTGSDCLLLLL